MEFKDRLIKTEEAAVALGLSPKTLRHYSSIGGGPLQVVRVGKSVRYRLSDINALIAGVPIHVQTKRGPGRPKKTK